MCTAWCAGSSVSVPCALDGVQALELGFSVYCNGVQALELGLSVHWMVCTFWS